MTFENTMLQIQDLQTKINQMISKLNKELLETIETENKKDTPMISTNPAIAIVPYHKIRNSKTHILSAEYYIPTSQVQAVRHKLNNCTSPEQLCLFVKQMLNEKTIKIGTAKTYLNETTLSVIRNSEIGQFVLNFCE